MTDRFAIAEHGRLFDVDAWRDVEITFDPASDSAAVSTVPGVGLASRRSVQ